MDICTYLPPGNTGSLLKTRLQHSFLEHSRPRQLDESFVNKARVNQSSYASIQQLHCLTLCLLRLQQRQLRKLQMR